MKDNIQILKTKISVTDLWDEFQIPGTPPVDQNSIQSPFRIDNKPSFSVYKTDTGLRFKDFGIDQEGDLIGLVAICMAWQAGDRKPMSSDALLGVNLKSPEACQETLSLFGHKQSVTASVCVAEKISDYQEPLDLSSFRPLDEITGLSNLMDNRGISEVVLTSLSSHGNLMIGKVNNYPSWILTDASHKAAQARRVDGQAYGHNVKSKSLPKSDGSYPIGLAQNEQADFFILCEGDTDYLAAHEINKDLGAAGVKMSELPIPLCMTGASKRIGTEALSQLSGKAVLIAGDNDDAGRMATKRWTEQLISVGCKVCHFPWSKIESIHKSGMGWLGAEEPYDICDLIQSYRSTEDPTKGLKFLQTVFVKTNALKSPLVEPSNPDSFLDEYIDAEFPFEAYPAHARDLLDAIKEHVPGYSKEAIAVSMLGFASAAVGRGLVAEEPERGFRYHANEYFLVTATSGSGKSLSTGPLKTPLEEVAQEQSEEWSKMTPTWEAQIEGIDAEIAGLSNRRKQLIQKGEPYEAITDMIAEAKDKRSILEIKLTPPTFSITSVTSERLADILAENGGYTFYFTTEAASAIEVLKGKYSGDSPDDSALLCCYSGDTISDQRIGRKTKAVAAPYMSILWLVTPDMVEEIFRSKRLKAGGALPRFLLCPLETKSDSKRTGPMQNLPDVPGYPDYSKIIKETFREYRLSKSEYTVTVSNDASDSLDEFRREIHSRFENKNSTLQPFACRWLEHTCKVAILLHVLEYGSSSHNHSISRQRAEGAIKVMRFLIGKFIEFTNITPIPELDIETRSRIIEWCKKSTKTPHIFTARNLRCGILRKVNTTEIDQTLEELTSEGLLQKIDPGVNKKKPNFLWKNQK
ncbi:MAG: DUF3987 domain-containing protein [Opitutaceae bacterium]